jgi:8-oxo-dGTP pyrophosphatase MutT (NUDIX family)
MYCPFRTCAPMSDSKDQPVRQSVAALAVFQRDVEGQAQFLAQWNDAWQTWALIGGHKRSDETFRQCLIREIEEELGLRVPQDVRLDEEPLTRLQFTAWSQRARANTQYEIEAYAARLLSQLAEQVVAANPQNRWLTRDEIAAGRASDGTAVSEMLVRTLAQCHDRSC